MSFAIIVNKYRSEGAVALYLELEVIAHVPREQGVIGIAQIPDGERVAREVVGNALYRAVINVQPSLLIAGNNHDLTLLLRNVDADSGASPHRIQLRRRTTRRVCAD